MSSKKKTNTTYQQSQTSAPPAWTQPGIQETSNRVIAALDTLPGTKYTGDFVAQPNKDVLSKVIDAYDATSNLSSQNAGLMQQLAQGISTAPDGFSSRTLPSLFQPIAPGQTPAAPDINSLTPTIAQANILNAPTLEQLSGLMPQVTHAQIVDQPDISTLLPKLPDAPSYVGWTPTGWDGGTNGEARLNAALTAAIQPVMRQLTQDILPGIRSSAIDAGAYSGDRAMSVLPTQAIAEASGRANEVSQGLAYQGFQAEQERSLKAWEAFQQLTGQAARDENSFNSGIYQTNLNALMDQFGIQANAATDMYKTKQGALLQDNQDAMAGGKANSAALLGALVDIFNTQQGAELSKAANYNQAAGNIFNTQTGAATDIYKAELDNNLAVAELMNKMGLAAGDQQINAFNAETAAGSTKSAASLNAANAIAQLLQNSAMMSGASGDIQAQIMELLRGADQASIDNALAKDTYDLQYPFRGLDIATSLLSQLSGNWGTTDTSGSQTQVTKSSGLGAVVQGIAGLASAAAGLGAFGPLGAAARAAASPVSGIFKNVANGK